ncbi:MAG: 50S ribosomal protein L15 [Patescibacteria group bacterium]
MKITVHTMKPAHGAKHSKKRVGRGNASGHGAYSTRGGKGQTARSGGSRGLKTKAFKRLMQSTPKLRGFKSLNIKPSEVYLSTLDKKFDNGAVVNLASLKEKKIINDDARAAKIIVNGELTKKLTVEGVKMTKTAKEIIEKLGGEVR